MAKFVNISVGYGNGCLNLDRVLGIEIKTFRSSYYYAEFLMGDGVVFRTGAWRSCEGLLKFLRYQGVDISGVNIPSGEELVVDEAGCRYWAGE